MRTAFGARRVRLVRAADRNLVLAGGRTAGPRRVLCHRDCWLSATAFPSAHRAAPSRSPSCRSRWRWRSRRTLFGVVPTRHDEASNEMLRDGGRHGGSQLHQVLRTPSYPKLSHWCCSLAPALNLHQAAERRRAFAPAASDCLLDCPPRAIDLARRSQVPRGIDSHRGTRAL